jgi:hypothetical protein
MMTDKMKLFFDHFIRHGHNHTDFPEESIQMREGLIFSELLDIEHKLPHSLIGHKQLNLLSRELAEIAIVVQGFAINHLKLHPSNDMLVQNINDAKPSDEVRHKNIKSTATNLEIGSSTDLLQRLVKKLWVNGIKQESIILIIGNEKVPIPKELRFKTVASLLLRLKRLSIERKVAAHEQLKSSRNQLYTAVEQCVGQYIQSFNNDTTDYWISQATPFITAIVLVVAGYLQKVDDYNPGIKRMEMKKYCSYQEILDMNVSQAKINYASGISSFDLPVN